MLNFVVDLNLPFSTIQQPSFKNMINTIAGKDISIPSTTVFMNFLKAQYDEMKSKLASLLDKQKYLCVTADVWSSRAQSYLGLTVHFINNDLERESFVLAFKQIQKRQTNDVLASEMHKVLQEYGITVSKITHIVTDGGSSFCKAFKVYGRGSDHLAENSEFNDDVEGVVENAPFMQFDDGEHFFSNIIQFDSDEDSELLSLENEMELIDERDAIIDEQDAENDIFDAEDNAAVNEIQLPPHRRCLSHILNLIGSNFEKNLSGRAKTAFVTTFSKLQTIWVFPRKSSQAKTFATEVLGCVLKIPCETRWNSKYDAVKHVFDLKPKINEYVDKLKENIHRASHMPKITNEDWVVISAYLKVMEPVATSLDILQSERNGDQGLIVPALLTMRHNIAQVTGGTLSRHFQEAMMNAVDHRFSKYLNINEINRELVVAAISSPKFKFDFIENDDDCSVARKFLIEECIKLSPNQNDENEPNIESQTTVGHFLSFASRRNMRRKSVEQAIEEEIDRYLSDDRTENKTLNYYPHVREVYIKFNTTLASSAVVERVFSQSALIFTPRRNRILSANFEYALLLKFNRKILCTNM